MKIIQFIPSASLKKCPLNLPLITIIKFKLNKKVLLRERKRTTVHRVASTRYTALSPDTGVPPSSPNGGYPHPVLTGGIPLSSPDGGTPHQERWVYTLPIRKDGSTLPWVWTDRRLWKQYLPVVLRTRTVNNPAFHRQLITDSITCLLMGLTTKGQTRHDIMSYPQANKHRAVQTYKTS